MSTVAKLAGVSQTTVSLVINKNETASIPRETRERVLAAVSELDYRPNLVARNLRTQRSALIGLVSDEIATTPYAGGIIAGTDDTAREHDKILVVVNTNKNVDNETVAINILLDQQVEGIIYAAMYHQPVRAPSILNNVPTVLLNCYDTAGAFSSVNVDEVSGGFEATNLLLAQGHRRIGFVNSSSDHPATCGRLAGYQSALAAHEVAYDPELVVAHDNSAEGGYQGTVALLGLASRPTALFCFSDRVAMGAYDAIRKFQLRVPDDIAVVGFDNLELIAAHLHPRLTTMELPHYEMGVWAVRRLMDLIHRTEQEGPIQHKIAPRLIVRHSA